MSSPSYAARRVYKVFIRAPIETVWSELVKEKAPRPFFWNSCWDTPGMQADSPFRMITKDRKGVGVVGKYLAFEPPRLLSHTFRLTSLDDPPSKVTYTLTAVDGGTEFCLITEDIIVGSKSEKSMDAGARFIVDNFKAYVETGQIHLAARVMNGFYALMSPLTPQRLRAEHWPLEE